MARVNFRKRELQLVHAILFRSCGLEEISRGVDKYELIEKVQHALSIKSKDKEKCSTCRLPLEVVNAGTYMRCLCCGAVVRNNKKEEGNVLS